MTWAVFVPFINEQFRNMLVEKLCNTYDYQKIWDKIGGFITYFHRFLDPAIQRHPWKTCIKCGMYGYRLAIKSGCCQTAIDQMRRGVYRLFIVNHRGESRCPISCHDQVFYCHEAEFCHLLESHTLEEA